MTYKTKTRIKTLLAAGLLAFNLSGCKKEIHGYSNSEKYDKRNIEILADEEKEDKETIADSGKVKEFRENLEENFKTSTTLTLDESADELISSIEIDGTNVSIELIDESKVTGTLYDLNISDVSFENFYIYDSKFTEDLFNASEKYQDYEEKGYTSAIDALHHDYENHNKLKIQLQNCSVCNEYKKGKTKDIHYNDYINYSNCKKMWLYDECLQDYNFSDMPNLETLILAKPMLTLGKEIISIQSNSLKNIIIDGQSGNAYIDKFDFTGCPNLEKISIVGDSQETNLDGLKGLKNLKELAFGLPNSQYFYTNGLIYKDFQERLDLVSAPFPTNDKSLSRAPNCIISDISAINGSNIEMLNISFLKCISSDMLLETVKSLPNLKQIVGFEVNNAGMCSDELIKYCEEHGIQHPFTEKSLEIKHKLEEIVSEVLTEDMDEEEKRLKNLKQLYDNREFEEDNISNEDIDKLIEMYDKEIEELKADTERIKNNIKQIIEEKKYDIRK